MKTNRTLFFVLIANLGALAFLLQFLRLPLPFVFPNFLELHPSNIPAIIGGFALGPIAGAAIVVIKFVLQFIFVPSYTSYVGEGIDVLLGVCTVVVSSLVYKKMKSKKGAIYGSLFGILTWVLVACVVNYTFLLDFYANLLTYPGQDGIEYMMNASSIIPGLTRDNFIWKITLFGILPFNVLLSTLVYGITFLVYKKVSGFINSLNERFSKDEE